MPKRATSTSFEKGRSGNPFGRPKVIKHIQEIAQQHGPKAIKAILELAESSQDERIRLAAWREILDRGYGRPTQTVAGDPDQPIQHVHEVDVSRLSDEQLAVLEALDEDAGPHPVGNGAGGQA